MKTFVKPADEGGRVVILNGALYRKLNLESLEDSDTHRPLNCNPTRIFQVKQLLEEGVNMSVLTRSLDDKLYIEFPITLIYHSLPKMHKSCFPPPLDPLQLALNLWEKNWERGEITIFNPL